ncbi:MAG: hypothetical protein JO267_10670 [Alphaproteobacteria bacterium]|nr:hypothetical protein [Alphaproteobacteria bacterium]
MRRPHTAALAALSLCLLLAIACAPARAQTCDEGNPASPARTTRLTLGPRDLVEQGGTELRTFVDTGSLGVVQAWVVSAGARSGVRTLAASPETSRYSTLYGEGLKGVALTVSLLSPTNAPRVTIELRQVCARYFRDTFLYY